MFTSCLEEPTFFGAHRIALNDRAILNSPFLSLIGEYGHSEAKVRIMENMSSVWEWAKADWQHDWEMGYTQACFFIGLGLSIFIAFLRPSCRQNFMKGFRGEE